MQFARHDYPYSRSQGLHIGLGPIRLEVWHFHEAEQHEAVERLDRHAIAQPGLRLEIVDVGLPPFGNNAGSRP